MRYASYIMGIFICGFIAFGAGYAQSQDTVEITLQAPVYATSPASIHGEGRTYSLWGASLPHTMTPQQEQKGRRLLQEAIGNNPLTCYVYRSGKAQCFTYNSDDLAEIALKAGYATAQLTDVAGTQFQDVYLGAESAAQNSGLGIWQDKDDSLAKKSSAPQDFNAATLIQIIAGSAGLILFAIAMVGLYLRKHMDKVHVALSQSNQLAQSELKVRKREQDLAAVMVHSELKSNHSKIEAYLIIYTDLLNGLRDENADHKYKRSGEVIRSAPALDRYIFDSQLDRLGSMGDELVARVVEFYNKIETDPSFTNLDSDMSHTAVLSIVESAVQRAEFLKQDLEEIAEQFDQRGFKSVNLSLSD